MGATESTPAVRITASDGQSVGAQSLLTPEPTPGPVPDFKPSKLFPFLVGALHVLVLLGFGLASYSEEPLPTNATGGGGQTLADVQLYNFLIGVALMMFVGFGYLMTFLRWYGLGAVGLTMLVTCLGLELDLL